MTTFKTSTGFGYFVEDATGNIVDKCEFPPGAVDEKSGEVIPAEHPIKEDYAFVEVATKDELDAVEVYIPPRIETPEQARERLIRDEVRAIAEERLRARGEI